jgi:hypothetical protein
MGLGQSSTVMMIFQTACTRQEKYFSIADFFLVFVLLN